MGCFYGKHLFECIKQLSDHAVEKLLKAALEALDLESTDFEICPHCGGSHFVRYGKKQATEKVKRKQERFPDQAPAYSFKIIFHSSVLQYSRSMQ